MKNKTLSLILLLLVFSLPLFSVNINERRTDSSALKFNQSIGQVNSRFIVPVYVRLQALEKGNVTLWESIPQDFSDHVASIDSDSLAAFLSDNAVGFNLSKDAVGNLWLAAKYSLNVGDYVSTLMWVTSRTANEDLSPIRFVPYPQNYPDDIKPFLESGRNIQLENQIIQGLSANFSKTQGNMTHTVQKIVEFVNQQGYDRETTRLLLSGNLNTTDLLDVFKDALQVYATNSSMCLERSWYAAAILRASGVPTRTVTDVRIKTWIQVWLPNIGWVDAETLCLEPPPHVDLFPKSISAHVPWMIENSSDAAFPLTWLPRVPMRIANLTFGDASYIDMNHFKTVLTRPVKADVFAEDPSKFRFPVAVEPETVYGAMVKNESALTFSVFKDEQNASKVLVLGEYNSITVSNLAVTFKPILEGDFLVLQDFAVGTVTQFDFRLLLPLLAIPVVLIVFWMFRMRRKRAK